MNTAIAPRPKVQIRTYPDPDLATKVIPVPLDKLNSEDVQEVISYLWDLIIDKQIVGLAAPQIGELAPIAVMPQMVAIPIVVLKPRSVGASTLAHPRVPEPFRPDYTSAPAVFINPTYKTFGRLLTDTEECPSFPGYSESISRYEFVSGRAFSLNGVGFDFQASNYEARILQRLFAHFEGKTILHHMDRARAKVVSRQMERQQ